MAAGVAVLREGAATLEGRGEDTRKGNMSFAVRPQSRRGIKGVSDRSRSSRRPKVPSEVSDKQIFVADNVIEQLLSRKWLIDQ